MSILGSAADLRVRLVMDGDKFFLTTERAKSELGSLGTALDKASRQVQRMENSADTATRGFRNTVITLGALRFALMDIKNIFIDIPTHIAKTAGEFERMEMLMRGLSKSTDEATQKLEAARDVGTIITTAKNAPFDVKALSDAYVKFKAAGLDPVSGGFKTLVDGVAKFGGSSETLKRASVAIQQMSGKGVVSMEELRQQLGEAIPNAMKLMADGMGLSVAELTEKVSKGIVTSKTALARMFAQMEIDSLGAAEKMMTTFPGALERLKTEFQLFEKTIADQGMMTAITMAMKELTDFMSSPEGVSLAKEIGGALREATSAAVSFGKAIFENADAIKTLFTAMLALYGGNKVASLAKGMIESARADRARLKQEADATLAQERKALLDKNRLRAQQIAQNTEFLKRRQAEEAIPKAIRDQETDMLRKKYLDQDRVIKEANERVKALAAERAQILSKPIERVSVDPAAPTPGGRGLSNQPIAGAPRRFKLADTLPFDAIQERANVELVKKANEEAAQARAKHIKTIEDGIQAARKSAEVAAAEKLAINSRNVELAAAEAAQRNLTSQVNGSNEALRRSIREDNEKIKKIDGLKGAAIGFASSIKEMGKTIGSSLLFGGAFFLAIEGLALLWDKVTESARRAQRAQEAAVRLKFGNATEQDRMDRSQDLAEANDDVRIKNQIQVRAQNKLGLVFDEVQGNKNAPAYKTALAQYEKATADLNAARDRAAEAFKKYKATEDIIRRGEIEADAGTYVSNVQSKIDQKVSEEKAKLGQIKRDAEVAIAKARADKLPKATIEKMQKDLADKTNLPIAQLRVDELTNAIDQVRSSKELPGDVKNAILSRLGDALANSEDQLNTLREKSLFQVSQKSGQGGPVIPNRERESPFEKAMQAINLRLVRQKNQIEIAADDVVTAGELAMAAEEEVRQMVESNSLDQYKNPTNLKDDTRREPTEEEKKRFTNALIEEKRIKAAKALLGDVVKLTTETKLAEDALNSVFAGSEIESAGAVKEVDKLKKRMESLREPIQALLDQMGGAGGMPKTFDELFSRGMGSGRIAVLKDMGEQYKRLFEDNKRMGVDEEQSEFERQKRINQMRVDQERDRIEKARKDLSAAGPLSEEDLANLKKLEGEVNGMAARLANSLSRSFRTPVQQMVDEWRNGFRQVQQAVVTFSNGLVDRLVDTKFRLTKSDVQDLAKTFFKDVAKTKFKDILGNMGGVRNPDGTEKPGLLNSGTNMLNEFLGLKQNDIGAKIEDGAMHVKVTNPYKEGLTGTDGATRIKTTAESMFETGKSWMESMKITSVGLFDQFKNNLGNLFTAMTNLFSGQGGQDGQSAGMTFLKALGNVFTNYTTGASGDQGINDGGIWNGDSSGDIAYLEQMSMREFALGGVMTQYGSLPLRKYANGGIARRPQLALFGEGRQPEAYVPLPDGRTIPVTMRGGAQQAAAAPSVSVNVINNSGTSVNARQQGAPRFDGRQMVLDVVLSGMSEPGNFRDNMRSAVGNK